MLIKRAGVSEKETPNISKYLTAMRERPAYQQATEKVVKKTMIVG
jgi:hypothetical protein